MGSRIPDRWLGYTAFGKRIANTPFIAFKCPLNEVFSRSLPPESKFGIEEIKTQLPQVSLIIDLTNTQKYYNPLILEDLGIEYRKIFTPGHVVPPKSKFYHFFHIVDDFMQNNKDTDKLIGVHCTHGVNRTGLFICSYMISKLGYDYETAVREFNSARGHEMERKNYLLELERYVKHPLKFKPGSYKIPEDRFIPGKIKPLMQVPPPLIPPYRVFSGPVRVTRNNDRIQSLTRNIDRLHIDRLQPFPRKNDRIPPLTRNIDRIQPLTRNIDRIQPLTRNIDRIQPLTRNNDRIQPLTRNNNRIKPLMHMPYPLMQPDFDFGGDPRPDFRPPGHLPSRQRSYAASCRQESRNFKPPFVNRNKRRA